MSEEPLLIGTHLRVYNFLRENEGQWFIIDEIAGGLGLRRTSVAQALSLVRRLPRIYEKTDPEGRRRFSFLFLTWRPPRGRG